MLSFFSQNNNSNNNNSNIEKVDYSFKVLFVGEIQCGKTSILERYCNGAFNTNIAATIGSDFQNKIISIDGRLVKAQLWGISNRTISFKSLTPVFFKLSKAIVFVYDITSIFSFECIQGFWYELSQRKGYVVPDCSNTETEVGYSFNSYKPVLLVMGAKADLRTKSNCDKCVDTEVARGFAESIGAMFFESSSNENMNIGEVLDELLTQVLFEYKKANGKTVEEIYNIGSSSSNSIYNPYQGSFKLEPIPPKSTQQNKTTTCNI